MDAVTITIDRQIFREYDIRGIVGPQLNVATVPSIARAIGTFFCRYGAQKIAIGFDARASSAGFAEMLIGGLTSSGCDVVSIGMVPTPVLYHTVNVAEVDGGVMITGSHNPPDHNGFKVCLGTKALFGDQIREIGEIAVSGDFASGSGTSVNLDVLEDYCSDIVSRVKLGRRKIKAVIDAGNGMGGVTAVTIYTALGLEIVKLFTNPDPNFPNHHPDPSVEENLEALVSAVLANKADLGIAFDGDGDRIGVIDEKGQIIWGDDLTALYAREILREHPGATVIGEVKCSESLFDEIAALGGKPIMWKAGHSLIKAKMKETGAMLAGEMSGHIFFADRFYGFDDATYAGARLIEILSSTDKTLSEMLAGAPDKFSTPEIRVPCRDDLKFKVVARIAAEFSCDHDVVTIDGARIKFEQGWGLVRASNTQAILVLRFEAASGEALQDIRAAVERSVNKAIIVEDSWTRSI